LDDGPAQGSEDWRALRSRTEAAWLALTYPRFLLREPFGPEGPRADGLDFQEEIGSKKDLLWGEASFLPAVFLSQEFRTGEDSRARGEQLQMEGMPFWNPTESRAGAPSLVEERLDPERAGALIREGIIPVVGFPNRAAVVLGGLHSLAGPNRKLRAWWRA
jgi:type VI secretion system protein ImpC